MINSALQTILKLVNSTTTPSNATVVIPSQKPIPTDVSSLLAFLLNFTALHDWIKLFLLGGLIESSRRFAYWVYNYITSLFFLSLHFDGDDVAYDWLMVWLSKQPGWSSARDLQISTRSFGLSLGQATLIPGEETDHGKGRNGESRTLAYLPSYGTKVCHLRAHQIHSPLSSRTIAFFYL
jgi:chaperone BCS1